MKKVLFAFCIFCNFVFAYNLFSDELYGFGDNSEGQLGDFWIITPKKIANDFVSVSCGSRYTIGIKTDGTLWSWGSNGWGQLGDGTTTERLTPTQIATDNNWQSIACGNAHSIGIKTDGTLWTWGDNSSGQLGDGTTTYRLIPTQIGADNDWKLIACGYAHTIGIKTDGTLWAWGNNERGQLGDGTTTDRLTPTKIGTENDWKSIASRYDHTMGIKTDGSLWAWGYNEVGQLGDGTYTNKLIPTKIGTDNDWKLIACGDYHNIGIKTNGTRWAWGFNKFGVLGDESTSDRLTPSQIGTENDWKLIACGDNHTMGIKTDGSIWAWGANWNGHLGDGTTNDKLIPTKIGTDNDWKSIACGYRHSIAVKTDGTLWAWGYSYEGQLGDGITADRIRPTKIGTDNDWGKIACGNIHTMGIKTVSTLWAWGDNNSGRLGDGTYTTRLKPTKIGSAGNDWKSVDGGDHHTIGIKTDGTLWAWGGNYYGQLGDEDIIWVAKTPTKIGTDNNWESIACGYFHTMAIKTDGTLWAWGNNGDGELGDGTTTNRLTPTKIGTGNDWKLIACGYSHTIGIKTDGSLWAWGFNGYGQLGDGTYNERQTPTRIGIATNNWQSIACGDYHTVGIKTGGTLWAWGLNWYGQLGDGTTTERNTPTKIGSANNWKSIACGYMYTMGLKGAMSWGFKDLTGNNSLIVVPSNIEPKIGNRDFMSGDAIGFFYTKDNQKVCAGYGIWDGNNMSVTVWGDDSETLEKDGFIVNESYTVMIWDGQEGKEYEASVTYVEGNSYYTVNGISVLGSLNAITTVTQNISLNQGWNLISTFVEPENKSMPVVWDGIKSFVTLVKNNSGQSYIPAYNINQIGNWNKYEGYQTYLTQSKTLSITGIGLEPEETTISLTSGWKLVPYLRNSPQSIVTAVASLTNDNALKLAKNNSGQAYIHQYNINQIGNMIPGQGYQMYLTKNSTLTYPANSQGRTSAGESGTPKPKILIPEHNLTGSNSTLLVSVDVPDGNEIGVYNQNDELIGSGVIQNNISSVTIWGDDEQTEIIEGALSNYELRIKNYELKTGRLSDVEIQGLEDFITGEKVDRLNYKKDAVYFAKAGVIQNSTNISLNVRPNPASDIIEIEFTTPDCHSTELSIYSLEGKLISNLSDKLQYLKSNIITHNISKFTSGEYTIILTCENERAMRKVMVVR